MAAGFELTNRYDANTSLFEGASRHRKPTRDGI
jgi:hypothetical protein